MKGSKRIGLSLSGGGYRAAAFHLGTLRALRSLNILAHVDIISTISGGSIAGAFYALNKDDFDAFESGLHSRLKRSVLRQILYSWQVTFLAAALFAAVTITYRYTYQTYSWWPTAVFLLVVAWLLYFFQFIFLPFTSLKVKAYRKVFFGTKTLYDLPDHPELAINATNLETGTLWTYSKRKVSDSSYEYPRDGGDKITFKAGDFPVALAVASSTNVPVPFAPVHIAKKYFDNPKDFGRARPALSDGGLYDNQGIHKITQHNSSYACDIIVCSDGSQPFSYNFSGVNSVHVLYRAMDIMMRKIKSLQFVRDVYSKKYEIAYFSLDWQYDNCITYFVRAVQEDKVSASTLRCLDLPLDVLNDLPKSATQLAQVVKEKIKFDAVVGKGITPEQIKTISRIKTGLSPLTDDEIDKLSRHAQTLTELQVRLYCPALL